MNDAMKPIDPIFSAMLLGQTPEPCEPIIEISRQTLTKLLDVVEFGDELERVEKDRLIAFVKEVLAQDQPELWATYSHGPGEIHPCMTKEHAEREAKATIDVCEKMKAEHIARGKSAEFWPKVVVDVIPSPFTPLEHFEKLAEETIQHRDDLVEYVGELENKLKDTPEPAWRPLIRLAMNLLGLRNHVPGSDVDLCVKALADLLEGKHSPAPEPSDAWREVADIAQAAAPAVQLVHVVPDGWRLVPERMELLPADIAAILFHCGGDEDATEIDEQYQGGLLWIGEVQDDDGNLVYGLHIASIECLEEGSTPLVEFAAAPASVQQAHMAGVPLLSTAAQDVLAERLRQINAEGYDASHDDMATNGQIAVAAGYYALICGWPHERDINLTQGCRKPQYWPWPPEYWKPSSPRRNLIKAGALILAEIERLDRGAAKCTEQEQQP